MTEYLDTATRKLEQVYDGEIVDEGWEEDEVGLPVYKAGSWEGSVSAWSEAQSWENHSRISKGAIVASVLEQGSYGEDTLVEFSKSVREKPTTLYYYAAVRQRLSDLEISLRREISEALEAGVLTYSHLKAVLAIKDDNVFVWALSKAVDENLSWQQLAREIKSILARQRAEEQQALEAEAEGEDQEDNEEDEEVEEELPPDEVRVKRGTYAAIVIDPPWEVQDIEREVRPRQVGWDYPTMTEAELAAFKPMRKLPNSDCHLYLWTTHKHLPAAFRLARAWGFNYQCLMTWRKNVGITPYSWMYSTEHVLFCRRGSLDLLELGKRLDFEAPVREHSRKPDEFYELVRHVSPGPRLDVFSRESRPGFDSWGNEAGKFDVA